MHCLTQRLVSCLSVCGDTCFNEASGGLAARVAVLLCLWSGSALGAGWRVVVVAAASALVACGARAGVVRLLYHSVLCATAVAGKAVPCRVGDQRSGTTFSGASRPVLLLQSVGWVLLQALSLCLY